jgi:CRP-like cAMP-binding protein
MAILPAGALHYCNASANHQPTTAMTTTAFCLLLCLLLLPVLVLLWATESREQRARRWRRQGLTQQAIATRLGCSRRTVGRLLTA